MYSKINVFKQQGIIVNKYLQTATGQPGGGKERIIVNKCL